MRGARGERGSSRGGCCTVPRIPNFKKIFEKFVRRRKDRVIFTCFCCAARLTKRAYSPTLEQMTLPQAPKPAPTAEETSLFDLENERSLLRLVPPTVGQAIEDAIFTNPELFDKDERDLYKHLRNDNKQPSPTDNRLRLKFWDEYDRVQSGEHKSMCMANVLAGICHRQYFYANYLKRAEKVAWLLCPPTGYIIKAEEALEFGLEQLRDLLEQPHEKNGRIDSRLGELKVKIVMMLDARIKGAVIQRSMNMNVNTSAKAVENAATTMSIADLNRELKSLDLKNRRAQNLPLAKPDIEIDPE